MLVVLDAETAPELKHASSAGLTQDGAGSGLPSPPEVSFPLPGRSRARRLRYTDDDDGNPVFGALVGFAMWCCCLPCVLYANERIAVKQAKLQGKALSNAVDIEDVNREPLPELNGHIVFLSGDSTCKEVLADKFFPNVRVNNCVKLRRIVEMRQNCEHVETKNGNERVSYSVGWYDSEKLCTRNQAYCNPPMPMPSSQRSLVDYRAHVAASDGSGEACAEAQSGAVRVGKYNLGEFVIREMENWHEQRLQPQQLAQCAAPELARRGAPKVTVDGDKSWWMWGSGSQVGDVRVRFEALECGPISLCGVLTRVAAGWTLVPIFREEGRFHESCAQEFGCTCAACPCAGERPVFAADPAEDGELLGWLQATDPELSRGERGAFLKQVSGHAQDFYQAEDGKGAMKFLNQGMHYMGLEEEFLGVAEYHTDIDDMLATESNHSRMKHCACRMCTLCCGVIASSLIIAPITYLLEYNWLIYVMGGGILSCFISCMSCCVSIAITLCIISGSWFSVRPRLGCTLCLLTVLSLGCAGAMVAYVHFHPARVQHGNSTIVTTLAPFATTLTVTAPTPTVAPPA